MIKLNLITTYTAQGALGEVLITRLLPLEKDEIHVHYMPRTTAAKTDMGNDVFQKDPSVLNVFFDLNISDDIIRSHDVENVVFIGDLNSLKSKVKKAKVMQSGKYESIESLLAYITSIYGIDVTSENYATCKKILELFHIYYKGVATADYKNLITFFYATSKDYFISKLIHANLDEEGNIFDTIDLDLMKNYEYRKISYINRSIDRALLLPLKSLPEDIRSQLLLNEEVKSLINSNMDLQYALVLADDHLQLLQHQIFKKVPNLAISVIFSNQLGRISIKSRNGIHIDQYCRSRGGNGHVNLSGYAVPNIFHEIGKFLPN